MSSACPACTSGTACVKHAREMARRSVDAYIPKAIRPEDWEPDAEFTRGLAHALHPRDESAAMISPLRARDATSQRRCISQSPALAAESLLMIG